MWGNAEGGFLNLLNWSSCSSALAIVPIYDGRGLNIRWNDIENMPRISQDLDLDAVVLVAHTTSVYGDTNVSLNVHFVVLLA